MAVCLSKMAATMVGSIVSIHTLTLLDRHMNVDNDKERLRSIMIPFAIPSASLGHITVMILSLPGQTV